MLVSQIAIISGASGVFGKSIAKSILKDSVSKTDLHSHLLLLGRDHAKLEKLKEKLNGINDTNITINVLPSVDFLHIDKSGHSLRYIDEEIKKITGSQVFLNSKDKRLWLFNNHGTLGDITKKATSLQPKEVQEYLEVNFVSFTHLCTLFKNWSKLANFNNKILINTSSLSAILPQPSLSLYSSVKACRESYFKSIAKEEDDIRTLSYSPGPLEGTMQNYLRTSSLDNDLRSTMTSLYEDGKLVNPGDSSMKLIQILNKNEFESGERIDYYDL